jgi:hypothetical protein
MNETLTLAITLIGTLGGWELVKYLLNRRSHQRQESATADISEIQADKDEFHLLRERLELADKQLLDKEQRFFEQTSLVRELNKELLEAVRKIGALNSEISTLKAERAMKLCERRGCNQREPQSGY